MEGDVGSEGGKVSSVPDLVHAMDSIAEPDDENSVGCPRSTSVRRPAAGHGWRCSSADMGTISRIEGS
jgi:hypothetical protein